MRRVPCDFACRCCLTERSLPHPHRQSEAVGRGTSQHAGESHALDHRPAVGQARQSHVGSKPFPCRDTCPDRLPGVPPMTTRLRIWLSTVDHKQIGVLYMVTGLFFFLIGGVEAMMMRA